MTIFYDSLEADFGTIYAAVDEKGACKVAISDEDWLAYSQKRPCRRDSRQCAFVIQELREYLRGERLQFTVSLSVAGTHFYRRVWQELCRIPYGQVKTYAEIAAAVGRPRAYRAVGMANYQNPLPILIPCHRVVGKGGKLTGYKGAGIHIKQYLLRLEGALTE